MPTGAHVIPSENQEKLGFKKVIWVISFVFTHYSIILKHVFIYILSVLIVSPVLNENKYENHMLFFCKRTTLYLEIQ